MNSDRRPPGTYLIADVSALTGVPPARLRSWERAGLLRPARSGGAVRVYPPEEVARARLIRRSLDNPGRRGSLRRLALRLEHEVLEPDPADWVGLTGAADASAEALPDIGWRTILDTLPAPVAIWDREGRLAHANRALSDLLGVDDPVSRPDSAEALTAPGALAPRWVARVGAAQEDVPITIGRPDDARSTVWRAVPVYGPDGVTRGSAAVGRAATQDDMLQRQREIDLAAAMGELRAPLGIVSGNLQLARRVHAHPGQVDGGDRLARHLRMAEAGVREALRLLDTLLDSSAVARGELLADLEAADLDLGLVARAAVDHAATLTSRHALRLVAPREPLPVVGDAGRLRELIDNLLANAAAFSPDGGPIEVSVAIDGAAARPQVRLLVADEGVGIRAEDAPHIFERYRRGNHVGVRGAGLGLYAARALAEAHGGELWIERTAVRGAAPVRAEGAWHGTVVALALPLGRGVAGAVPVDRDPEGPP